MKVLNLGCGTKTSSRPEIINIDWSFYLRLRRSWILRTLAWPFLSKQRRGRLQALPENILVHDLAKGVPFPDNSVDAVYHSHLLEHLDRDVAPQFLVEVRRVLKSGGILRIVVPDMERLCREYLDHLESCEQDPTKADGHDDYISAIIEQCVRREGAGTAGQGRIARVIDRLVLGDARRRGETHQWMYDHVNLRTLLVRTGFRNPTRVDHKTSVIPGWNRMGLDRDADGGEYKPGSLYMEATK